MIIKYVLRPLKTHVRSAYWKFVRFSRGVPKPVNAEGLTLLHLGCGPIDAPGYTNIDVQPLPHVHYVESVYPLSFIQRNSVDLVYASHVLEHFAHADVPRVLKDWRRVLKKGGILRLGVPNLEVLFQIYTDTKDLDYILGPLMGGQTDPFNFHYTAFDRFYLTKLLRESGFVEIRDWDPQHLEEMTFKDTTSNVWAIAGKEYPISLNIEAVK